MEKKETVCYTMLKHYLTKIKRPVVSILSGNSLTRERFEGRKGEKYDE